MRRGVVIASLLFGALGASAQPPRPPSGITVDETREVKLRVTAPKACIAVPTDAADVVVLLARRDLEQWAQARPADGTSPALNDAQREAARMALVRGNRAKAVLDLATGAPDAQGCQAVQGPLDADARHLLVDALEQGQAVVRDMRSGRLAPLVRIRYLGDRCSPNCGRGDITVRLPDASTPFLVVSWWVS